jgi:hypothetical protein
MWEHIGNSCSRQVFNLIFYSTSSSEFNSLHGVFGYSSQKNVNAAGALIGRISDSRTSARFSFMPRNITHFMVLRDASLSLKAQEAILVA